ncbi:alpha/beta fold hydrolase [Pirellulaceae bacterium]|nr:alpha/beta fold hydrolase [Pirellulaceae bacterium]
MKIPIAIEAMTTETVKLRRRWLKRTIVTLLIIAFIAVSYDLSHSIYVNRSIAEWENNVIGRDENGVAIGHQAYSVGSGTDAILFIHGLNDSPLCWKYMAPKLGKANYYCQVMRLPGFAEAVEDYSLKSDARLWLESISMELALLRKSHRRVFVIAHSLGAVLILNHVLENETSINGLALLAPALDVPPWAKRKKFIADCIFHFTTAIPASGNVPVRDKNEQEIPNRMLFTPLKTIDQLFHLNHHLVERADEITMPVFVAVGKFDKNIDVNAVRTFFDNISTLNKEKFVCEQSDHKITVDHDWVELTDKIEFFFHSIK